MPGLIVRSHIFRLMGIFLLLTLGAIQDATASDILRIPLHIESQRSIRAFLIAPDGQPEEVMAARIEEGHLLVPRDFSFPIRTMQKTFESVTYTLADLEAKRPLRVRELGAIGGTIAAGPEEQIQNVMWLLQKVGAEGSLQEIPVQVADGKAFEVSLAAGIYRGILVSDGLSSRLRPGVVVEAGEKSNLGEIMLEPTASVSFLVLDAETDKPVPGAMLIWSPPPMMNREAAASLLASRLSTKTDENGRARLDAVGPVPLAAQWRIERDGYAVVESKPLEIHLVKPIGKEIIRVSPRPRLIVHVAFPDEPRDRQRLVGAVMKVLSGDRFSRRLEHEQPLESGKIVAEVSKLGVVRILIESSEGKPLLYEDLELRDPVTRIDLPVRPVEIFGRVLNDDEPVSDIWISVAHPVEGQIILGETFSTAGGNYSLVTFQRGKVTIGALGASRSGFSFYPSRHQVDIGPEQASAGFDIELPTYGATLKVLDAVTREPVRAKVSKEIKSGESTLMGLTSTNDQGVLEFSSWPESDGKLIINARGYHGAEIDLHLTGERPEREVLLTRAERVGGVVVDSAGRPVPNANLTAGYSGVDAGSARQSVWSDSSGSFELDSAPVAGSVIYVTASGFALSVVELKAGLDNRIVMFPPNRSSTFVRPDQGIPSRTYIATAMTPAGDLIPLGVLNDLAGANGLNGYQLFGTGRDGLLTLPQYLSPGTWNLSILRRGGSGFVAQGIGRVAVPSDELRHLFYKED